jgi:putative phosphoesterase
MKKIGLLSDTHNYLDPKIYQYFADVDEIWHAGDIGDISITDELKNFKPLRAVYGNIDNTLIRSEFPEFNRFEVEGIDVLITHIGGRPGNYSKPVAEILKTNPPKLFICGHSHILLVKLDPKYNMLCMNPGAVGNKGFHSVKTILRFEIENGKIQHLEAIELGKRNS